MNRLRELGIETPEVRLIGASSVSRLTRQMLADALGATVVPVSSRHGAAVGAAMQAAVGFFQDSGEFLDFAELATYLVTGDSAASCHPDPAAHAVYQEMIVRQEAIMATLRPAGFA
jgi:xylulokinase